MWVSSLMKSTSVQNGQEWSRTLADTIKSHENLVSAQKTVCPALQHHQGPVAASATSCHLISQDSVAQVTCRVEDFSLSRRLMRLIGRNFGRQTAHELPISLHVASYVFASPLASLRNFEERTINSKTGKPENVMCKMDGMYSSLAVECGKDELIEQRNLATQKPVTKMIHKFHKICMMFPIWQISRIEKNLLW